MRLPIETSAPTYRKMPAAPSSAQRDRSAAPMEVSS